MNTFAAIVRSTPAGVDLRCYDIKVNGIASQAGDSGSPLFSYKSGVGNVIWGNLRAGGSGYSLYCNIQSVIRALNVTCIPG